jgi:CRISPR-associated exonuclease Cas4
VTAFSELGFTLSVSDLKNYALCPAIPWINRKLGWREPETYSMAKGKGHDLREASEGLPEPRRFNVFLRDRETGLSGVIDVLCPDCVAEVKAFKRGRVEHFRLQLLAYAYLAVKNGHRVRHAYLILGKEVRLKVEVNEFHLEEVRRRALELRRALLSESPPLTNPDRALCSACQYRKVCPFTPHF